MIYHGDFHDFDIKADVLITEPLFLRDKSQKEYDNYIEEVVSFLDFPVKVYFQPDFREIPKVFDGWVVSDVYTGKHHDFLVSNIGESKVYKGPGQGRNPRPIEIMSEVVEDFSNPGDIIYDPFAGYGSTGVACKDREFIGVEISKYFYEICTLRCS